MGDFFMGLIKLGLFFQFGLPILVGILVLIVSAFAPGSILSFCGRLSRKKYFLYVLGDFALLMVGMLLAFWGEAQSMSAVMDVGLILAVVSFIFFYSLAARRLHDFGQSAWWCLALFVMFRLLPSGPDMKDALNLIIFAGLALIPGDKGNNRYGPDPLDPTNYPEVW